MFLEEELRTFFPQLAFNFFGQNHNLDHHPLSDRHNCKKIGVKLYVGLKYGTLIEQTIVSRKTNSIRMFYLLILG